MLSAQGFDTILERIQDYQAEREAKAAKAKDDAERRQLQECSFAPEINRQAVQAKVRWRSAAQQRLVGLWEWRSAAAKLCCCSWREGQHLAYVHRPRIQAAMTAAASCRSVLWWSRV